MADDISPNSAALRADGCGKGGGAPGFRAPGNRLAGDGPTSHAGPAAHPFEASHGPRLQGLGGIIPSSYIGGARGGLSPNGRRSVPVSSRAEPGGQ